MPPSADRFRRAANRGRIAAYRVAQRPTTVTIRVETYSGSVGANGVTLSSTSDTVLYPNPDVNPVGDLDSWYGGGSGATSGAKLRAPQYSVGPITSLFPGGGYADTTLAPTGGANKRVLVVLAGGDFPDAGESYSIADIEERSPQSTYLLVERSKQ